MKMKKIVLLLSMFVFAISMTACSDGQEKVDFDYTDLDVLNNSVILAFNIQTVDEATKTVINNTEGQEVYQTAISNFESAAEECGELTGFRGKDGNVISLQDIASANSESTEAYQQCLTNLAATVEEDGAEVKVVITAAYEDRDADMSFVYEGAPEQTSVDDTTGAVTTPFKVAEVTVTPDYTLGEKMAKAGMNTLMGMGTVFAILIFIAIVIAQFGRISNAVVAVGDFFTKKKEKKAEASKEETQTAASAPVAVATPANDNLVNDAQLVAVITAAIMAAEGTTAGAGSDGLIVRSIKKAKRY